MGQREEAIRFWLGRDDDEPLQSASQVEAAFIFYLTGVSPRYWDYVTASFVPIARGGLSTDLTVLTCYADYTVPEYLLGAGPTTLAAAYDGVDRARSYELYSRSHAAGEFGPPATTPRMTEAEYEAMLAQRVADAEAALAEIIEGREAVVFLVPMGAHNAIAVEVWQAVAQWDLQTDDQGTVNAVRFGTPSGDPEHTQTLANLKGRITAATTATSTATTTPTRISSISGLTQYYRDIGAYGDITPDDGSTETFTPAQPPPVYAPAPASLTATGSGEDTADLSWSSVRGASGYHVQHRGVGAGRWTTADASVTGTDHGSGGVSFLIGDGVKGGHYGEYPSLDADNLVEGDLAFNLDFRSVYTDILEDWLEIDAKPIVKGEYEKVGALNA